MAESTHQSPVKTYFLVFGSLGILTGLTVAFSYMELTKGAAVIIASLISLTKISLIAVFFMHLKSESRGIQALLYTALFFVAVLILALIPDLGLVN